MTANIISLMAAMLTALCCGLFSHIFFKEASKANLVGVIYTVLTFQILGYVSEGSMDPNWHISSLIIAMVAYPVIFFQGVLIQRRRLKREAAKRDELN